MNDKLYHLNDPLDFRVGHKADLTQVLIARCGERAICVCFTPNGEYMGYQHFAVGQPAWDIPDPSIERLLHSLSVRVGPITIRKFYIKHEAIGILDIPGYLQEYIDGPDTSPQEHRKDLAEAVEDWKRSGSFCTGLTEGIRDDT